MIHRAVYFSQEPYLKESEREQIRSYLATIKQRLSALQEIKKNSRSIADATVARIRQIYPQFGSYHAQGYEKGVRDLTLVTNMLANAVFLGENYTMDEIFTEWYRTILKASHLSPQFLKDTFAVWLDVLAKILSEESFTITRPHAEHIAFYLTQVPVPAKDEIGRRVIQKSS